MTMGMDEGVVYDIDARDLDSDRLYLREGFLSDMRRMIELGSVMEILTRVELELANTSEKLFNLDMFLMHVLALENELEVITDANDFVSPECIKKVTELDFLSIFVDSEVTDLENFMLSLQTMIIHAHQQISSSEHSREFFIMMEVKLHDLEDSLKQSQEQVSEMKLQLANLQKTLLDVERENWKKDQVMDFSENEQLGRKVKKIPISGQQRHILRMLEKSLERELDLEKKILDLKQNEEHLKLKLHLTERVFFCMEEASEVVWGRFYEAENAAEVLMGISKEMVNRLRSVQLSLNASSQREGELKSKIAGYIEQKDQEFSLGKHEIDGGELKSMQQAWTNSSKSHPEKVEDKHTVDEFEVIALKEKVKFLEEQLKESEIQLKTAIASDKASLEQLCMLEDEIELLKENYTSAEIGAESADARVNQLSETNLELTEELDILKGGDEGKTEKITSLEKQVRELEMQLQHARASSEAGQEQNNMLYSAIWDMETLIEELKSKVSKAENKAEDAEEQCLTLSELKLELNNELDFLSTRVAYLETALCQANDAREQSAKDISMKTKFITNMLMQLTNERERIQTQLLAFSKENKMLVKKLRKIEKGASVPIDYAGDNGNKEFILFAHDKTNSTLTTKNVEAISES
ncbi:hypothetical protein RJ641_012356 [Dillenia turbinata]|uniref:WIT1/2 N-terminal helical bundle domain-containing protein n=1 Tax=Dillenia turbinata TaxID=194707 RepID=A0AAN8UW73_9MAGN